MTGNARAYKTRAIVLRSRQLGEADRIYTLLTRDDGKVDAVGKGVRRSKSHLAGRLEFGSEVALGLHRGRSLDVITSAELIAPSWTRVTEPAAYGVAQLVAELVDACCEPDWAVPDVYALLRGMLHALAAASDPAQLVPRFELRLLHVLGVGPESERCIACGTPLDYHHAAWADVAAGGLACAACRPHSADALELGPADLRNFRGLAVGRNAGGGASVAPILVATPAAARAVDAFVLWHLGRRPKATSALAELAG